MAIASVGAGGAGVGGFGGGATSPTGPSRRPVPSRRVGAHTGAPLEHEPPTPPAPPPTPPPRVLHSASHAQLDPPILHLLSLICRWYVLQWYSSISRDPDRDFVRHITTILIHVIQALEVRLAAVDLVELAALDVPALLEQHALDLAQSDLKAHSAHAHNLDRDAVFHSLQPHLAISLAPSSPLPSAPPTPVVDKTYLRALVDNLLRLLLPPEDYRAETERTVVREIIVNIVLGNVFDKVAQPWFLHQIIARVIEGRQAARREREGKVAVEPNPPGLRSPSSASSSEKRPPAIAVVLRGALATLTSLPTVFRAVAVSLSTLYHTATASPVPPHFRDRPPLTTPTISLLLALLPDSPVLSQAAHYVQLVLALASGFVTSLVFYVYNEKVFTPQLTKTIVEVAANALFPDGRPPAKVPDPTPDEQVELRKRCEERVAEVLPPHLVSLLIPPSVPDRPLALSQHLLRPISSHVANVHLFVLVLDLVLGRVFPELVVQD
ncbi:hypothetical protein RQP46_004645 [Phenoliferia psychrophenolica]